MSYDPEDLVPLSRHNKLTRLVLKGRPAVRSLSGLDYLPHLRTLEVLGAAQLSDIGGMSNRNLVESLTRLNLEGCRLVTTLAKIGKLVNLTYLNVSEGGSIQSLTPLVGLQQLQALYLHSSTRIADNNLEPLLALKSLTDLRMQSRKTYRPALADVKSMLGI